MVLAGSGEILCTSYQLADEFLYHALLQRLGCVDPFPLVQTSNEFIPADCDLVGGSVGDGHIADLVIIEFDQLRTTL